MKFAESLDESLVPEWRENYLKYKTGKRLVKAIQRAVNRMNGVADPRDILFHPLTFHRKNGVHSKHDYDIEEHTPLRAVAAEYGGDSVPTAVSRQARTNETGSSPASPVRERHVAFEGEAVEVESPKQSFSSPREQARRSLVPLSIPSEPLTSRSVTLERAMETPKPGGLRRFPTGMGFQRVATQLIEIKMHPVAMLDLRKQEFVDFLDHELEKVEVFYKQKEDEASTRLDVLRKQLHIMRERRNEETRRSRRFSFRSKSSDEYDEKSKTSRLSVQVKSKLIRDRSNSRPLQTEPFTPISPSHGYANSTRDFVRKPSTDDKVSYRAAKHKLRLAVQELYRSLEFLKSYSILNRTAFRKLNKKYDKVLGFGEQSTLLWFHQKIDNAHFVNSTLVDDSIETVKDLYARYLEQGNRKLASEKLQQLTKPKGDKSKSALLNGLMVGVGLTFGIEGLELGIRMLNDEDDDRRAQAPFLLQLYAGYFLMLYLFSWFCFSCRTWTRNKINYPFIFEFDPRHDLDWRQLANFPCFFTLVLGVFMWFNFSKIGNEDLFVWYPVMLIGFTLMVLLLPLPVLRWRSRRWFAIAHWRLLLSGLYPVEFRDFFLGDMYCSLTYAITNAELFFCLYARQWNQPVHCSSRFSRLVGFAATIPLIWRSLQCVRRFWDSRNVFPHLANLLKYTLAIAASVTLSLFRLDNDPLELSLFIAFASISAFYSALWDLFMDFSLLQSGPYPGLRDTLAFDKPWMYYGIIGIDPILRFSWILSVIFTHRIQHSSYVAFIIAFTEATRRGMWTLFRVENEHCTNIKLQKASRDMPLPYSLGEKPYSDSESGSFNLVSMRSESRAEAPTTSAIEDGTRQKTGLLHSLSKKIGAAHRQDFQKGKAAPTIEETQEPEGIEEALLDDEGSDDEGVDVENLSQAEGSRRGSSEDETERVSQDETLDGDTRR